jgi:8-oxo-dGTP pyrophosphatase MutT (NUDIX family)
VRPRLAASLILLRTGPAGPEVLMGRRGRGARFMPGRYVFPGGRVGAEDRRPWRDETGRPLGLPPGGGELRLPRAALRELFEETGMLIGAPRETASPAPAGPGSPVEDAYRSRGLRPDLSALTYVARAITPTSSPIRFHAHFFLADGAAAGDPADSTELEDVGWRPADPACIAPMSDVTQFMLSCAVAVWGGARNTVPLYSYARGAARIVPRRET